MSKTKPTLIDISDLMTQTEAAKLKRVTTPTIHNFILRGQLQPIHIRDKTFVQRSEVLKLRMSWKYRTDAELIEDVLKVAKKLGRLPNSSEYKKRGSISVSCVCRRFGGWANAIAAARRVKNIKATR